MTPLLLFPLYLAVVLLVASGAGRLMIRIIGIAIRRPLDRLVYSAPIGLGIIAYIVLALGLAGLLSPIPIGIAIGALAAVSFGGIRAALRDLVIRKSRRRRLAAKSHAHTSRAANAACAAILAGALALAFINCFVPPGAHEWDALSYHLAAPKVYLERHQIVFLPTDHHSNFPFTMEMLFTLGLMFGGARGYALANLFHLAAAGFCAAGLFSIARRSFAAGTGRLAALTFATAPIVVWEAGAAYIEMGLALYVLLAVGAALRFRRNRNPRWLALAGVLMGFALSIKALALVPFLLVAALLLLEGARFRNLRWYLAFAVIVGCPFYVKSWVWTGNPVYPFAYRAFGGRYWNADLAAGYSAEQRSFGQSGARTTVKDDANGARAEWSPPTVADRARNLAMAPFELVAIPRIFYNFNDPGVHSHLGFLFLALPPLLLLAPRTSNAAKWIGGLSLLWFAAWSQTMQYVRYMAPMLPVVGLAGGEGGARLTALSRIVSAGVVAAVGFQAALTFAYFGPRLPDQWARATSGEARERYLAAQINIYDSEQWINRSAPPGAGVVLYEDTRGFYLDRPYLWGNSPHSLYIPYSRFATGQEMADWFRAHGVQYALLNLQFSPGARTEAGALALRQAVIDGTTSRLLLEWYRPNMPDDERWRRLLGDALHGGAAVPVPEAAARGAVVIRFLPGPPGARS